MYPGSKRSRPAERVLTMKQGTRRATSPGVDATLGVARIGRREPYEAFYRRELPKLVALAHALCGPGVADDVAQEAMLAAYRRWDVVSTYDIPEAWVRRVCINEGTSILRRRALEAAALLRLSGRRELPALPPEDDAFWSIVRGLPRRQAQATALRYVYGMSVTEIAATMECSEGTAKVHLFRGRQTLARRMGLEEVTE